MDKRMKRAAAVAVLGLWCAAASWAQDAVEWKGGGGWGPGQAYARLYDPKTVETLGGEIVAVEKFTPGEGMAYGIHATLKTDKETLAVHLGPGWFVENQEVQLAAKDKVEVKGSRVTFDGKPALIAAEVKKGGEVLVLRDEAGFPAWSGRKAKAARRGRAAGQGQGMGQQKGKAGTRMYNAKTVETLRGEVLAVEKRPHAEGTGAGIHATLKTDKETIDVHLGPDWFVENQETKLEAKDEIEVKGSRVTVDGKPALIAAEVKKGEEELVLRDANGFPAWSGCRRE